MSAPNKSYDPVEVEALKPAEIDACGDEALAAFAAAADLDALKAARLAHPGDRSPLALANREIGALPPRPRPRPASASARPAARVSKALAARQAELEAERDARVLVEEAVDVTLPYDRAPGRRPPPARAGLRSGSRTSSWPWAGRSPRAPRSSPSGSTSTR